MLVKYVFNIMNNVLINNSILFSCIYALLDLSKYFV